MSWRYATVALRIDIGSSASLDSGKDVDTYGSSGLFLKGPSECYVLSLYVPSRDSK